MQLTDTYKTYVAIIYSGLLFTAYSYSHEENNTQCIVS